MLVVSYFTAMFGKVTKFWAKPGFIQLWFVPVFVMLALSRATILLIEFRKFAPKLGETLGEDALDISLTPAEEARLKEIRQVIALAARYAPFTANCFPQAITARIMMGIYGLPYILYFGVRHGEEKPIEAHAWVMCGDISVCGGDGTTYAVVGRYGRI